MTIDKTTTIPSKPADVYFFGTCLVDLFYPEAGLSAIELIEREGINVLYPQAQTCCGQPPFNSGYNKEAMTVAAQQINIFSDPIPIIVPSASCAGMMKHHYATLFKHHSMQLKANEFSSRIYELTEFLVKVLDISLADKGKPITVALHTSCSARREMAVADDGMSLLKQLKNVTLVEPERAAECCGFGGTFSIKQPEISAAMTEDKCQSIERTGASTMVSGDCGCLMNLNGVMEKNNRGIKGEHLASFLINRTRT